MVHLSQTYQEINKERSDSDYLDDLFTGFHGGIKPAINLESVIRQGPLEPPVINSESVIHRRPFGICD